MKTLLACLCLSCLLAGSVPVLFRYNEWHQAVQYNPLKHWIFIYDVLEVWKVKINRDRNGKLKLDEMIVAPESRTPSYSQVKRAVSHTPRQKGGFDDASELHSPSDAELITNSLGMQLKLVPAGEFLMGSTPQEIDEVLKFDLTFRKMNADSEQPQHRVRITRPFYLGVYEVTKGQFAEFVRDQNYKTEAERDGKGGYGTDDQGNFQQKPEYTWRNSGFPQTDDHPVVNVSWNDAVAYCEWLSRKEGRTYRLPSEAEWEYACRAGTTTMYQHGHDPEELALVGNVADGTAKAKITGWNGTICAQDGYVFTAPVGSYRPNAFGLYDLHGNVYEWCQDLHDATYYASSPASDPSGPTWGNSSRVLRGGGWDVTAGRCRSAYRCWFEPSLRRDSLGFRCALSLSNDK